MGLGSSAKFRFQIGSWLPALFCFAGISKFILLTVGHLTSSFFWCLKQHFLPCSFICIFVYCRKLLFFTLSSLYNLLILIVSQVHARCYGELEPVDGVLWLCKLCRPGAPDSPPPCCLCPVTGIFIP